MAARRRKKGRRRGTSGRANSDLTSHLASLGLESPSAYQAWCREHGFTGALNKSWHERRLERKAVDQAGASAREDAAFRSHLKALGLDSEAAYTQWCVAHELSTGTHKSAPQRKKEVDLARRLESEAVLLGMKDHTRRLHETIRLISEDRVDVEELKRPHLQKMHEVFQGSGKDRRQRKALLRLLLHAESHADLFGMKAAFARLGPAPGNTMVEGLDALASWEKHWLESPESWRPDSHNSRRQFGSLARHLLARYDVPAFVDAVWFLGNTDEARRQQLWSVHIGTGGNIRKADVPVALTKKMAHLFLKAPDDYTVCEALRWGQILGLGGDERLVRAVNATRLGRSFENEAFWGKVIHFFVNNPMLDPDQVDPIVDFIHNQKFVPREEVLPGGEAVELPPLQPNFSIKGRSAVKLLRQVEAWHRRLNRETRLPARVWEPCDIQPFEEAVTDRLGRVQEVWRIRELLSTKELSAEGRQMHHCVASYAGNCKNGNTSVWSMQVETPEEPAQRVMTIAVHTGSRSVTQARGRYNALPSGRTPSGQRKGFEREYQRRLRHTRHILYLWRQQEGLSMSPRA